MFVGKGNNSAVVKQAFKRRWWWAVAEAEDGPGVCLWWTQTRQAGVMARLAPGERPVPGRTDHAHELRCLVNYSPETNHLAAGGRPVDLAALRYDRIFHSQSFTTLQPYKCEAANLRLANKLENSRVISEKKGLVASLA